MPGRVGSRHVPRLTRADAKVPERLPACPACAFNRVQREAGERRRMAPRKACAAPATVSKPRFPNGPLEAWKPCRAGSWPLRRQHLTRRGKARNRAGSRHARRLASPDTGLCFASDAAGECVSGRACACGPVGHVVPAWHDACATVMHVLKAFSRNGAPAVCIDDSSFDDSDGFAGGRGGIREAHMNAGTAPAHVRQGVQDSLRAGGFRFSAMRTRRSPGCWAIGPFGTFSILERIA